MLINVFDSLDMPKEIRHAYNRSVKRYDPDVYLLWDMTHSYYDASNNYIKVNNWLIAQTEDTDKQVLIKQWWFV